MAHFRTLLIIATLVVSFGAVAPASASTTTAGVQGEVLTTLNAVRASHGLGPLTLRARFTRVARLHARDMVVRDYFDHDTLGGPTWNVRVRAYAGSTLTLGENIGYGTSASGAPAAMVQGWMTSPDHRRNILDPAFRLVGIGMASGAFQGKANARVYVTDFGG